MSKHNFGYFIHEGVSNMFSHGFMSFAAIGITVACLLIMGTFTLVAVNANGLLKDLERENEMLAFVEEDFQEPQSLQQKLEAIPNVVSATFISRQQAMENFLENYPEEEMFRDLDPNILRDRFPLRSRTWSASRRQRRRWTRWTASPMPAPLRRSPGASSPCGTWRLWSVWR